MKTTAHCYQQIFMFDDIDTDNAAIIKDNEKENLIKMIRVLDKMLSANPDKERVLLDTEKGYEITAFIGGNKYYLSCKGKIKSDVSVCEHKWLSSEDDFNRVINDMLSATAKSDMQSLFLVDWSLSEFAWGIENEEQNATRILSRIKNAIRSGQSIRGTLACYSSSADHSSFVNGFEEEAKEFAKLDTLIKPIKLLWRWDDIQSTLFTLYRKLCRISEAGE